MERLITDDQVTDVFSSPKSHFIHGGGKAVCTFDLSRYSPSLFAVIGNRRSDKLGVQRKFHISARLHSLFHAPWLSKFSSPNSNVEGTRPTRMTRQSDFREQM